MFACHRGCHGYSGVILLLYSAAIHSPVFLSTVISLTPHAQLTGRSLLQGAISGGSATLPEALGCSLMRLDLHQNSLSGPVPSELMGFPLLSLLNLAHNQLQGTVPALLGALADLNYLDLSSNHLTGAISEEGVSHASCPRIMKEGVSYAPGLQKRS